MTEHERLTRDTEFGQRAKVQRTEYDAKLSEHSAERLKDIGRLLNPYPDTSHYLGSAAVHYFYTPGLSQAFFACQTLLSEVPEGIVQPGLTDLRGYCLEAYGHSRQTKRSGF